MNTNSTPRFIACKAWEHLTEQGSVTCGVVFDLNANKLLTASKGGLASWHTPINPQGELFKSLEQSIKDNLGLESWANLGFAELEGGPTLTLKEFLASPTGRIAEDFSARGTDTGRAVAQVGSLIDADYSLLEMRVLAHDAERFKGQLVMRALAHDAERFKCQHAKDELARLDAAGAFDTEEFGFAQELVAQYGGTHIDGDATVFAISTKDMYVLMKVLGYGKVAEAEDIKSGADVKGALESALEVLESAQNGLRWYQTEYPEADSCADDELHQQIEESMSKLKNVLARAGVR